MTLKAYILDGFFPLKTDTMILLRTLTTVLVLALARGSDAAVRNVDFSISVDRTGTPLSATEIQKLSQAIQDQHLSTPSHASGG